jgi:telomerase reverse transcriptase
VTDIEWLTPSRLMGRKTSHTDIEKRRELFYEFLYYIFDSVLIPLLRSNFYVTESNTDKYRLFFFRHDVWRYVAEPAMTTLKHKMFEEVTLEEANRILNSRQMGFSQVRLLPKGSSMRPIMNLRKKKIMPGQKNLLGHSINTVLKPVHSILLLEKVKDRSIHSRC